MEGVPLRGEASRRSADEDGLADALGAANVRGRNYYH